MAKPKQRVPWVLARSITIPAGTQVSMDPPFRRHYAHDSALIVEGPTADTVWEWRMDLKEAIDTGLVRKAEVVYGDAA